MNRLLQFFLLVLTIATPVLASRSPGWGMEGALLTEAGPTKIPDDERLQKIRLVQQGT